MPFPDASTPTFLDAAVPHSSRDAYPAWVPENNIPLSKEEIEDIFLDLTQKFGFQRDSMRNMVSCPDSLVICDLSACAQFALFWLSYHWHFARVAFIRSL